MKVRRPRLNDGQRLALITEAVKYCQRVRGMGMPYSSYTKALREPVYFLWELRGGRGKDFAAKFRSKASVGVRRGRGELIYDHAIPFRYLQEELLGLTDVSPETVRPILERHCVAVLLTRAEDARLAKARLARHMPADRDGSDVLARYVAVGIDLIQNS